MTKLLLVGGCEKDERKLAPKLSELGAEVGWHWMNLGAMATRGTLPSCDGVLVFTRACSHSLSRGVVDLAKKAGVPVVPVDSWPRLRPALQSAGLVQATMITIATPTLDIPMEVPVAPAPVQDQVAPLPTKGHLKVYPNDDDVLLAAHSDWEALTPAHQATVRKFLAAFDKDRNLSPVTTPKVFSKYAGKARDFVTFCILATPGEDKMTPASLGFLYQLVSGKRLHYGTTINMAEKVKSFCGDEYGVRRGRPGSAGTPLPSPPLVVAPPPPIQDVVLSHPSDDEVLRSTVWDWDGLQEESRVLVREFLRGLDQEPATPLSEPVSGILSKYVGSPRAFIVFCVLATRGDNQVRSVTLKRAYTLLSGKVLRSHAVPRMVAKVQEFNGQEYGLRKDDTTTLPPTIKTPTPPETLSDVLAEIEALTPEKAPTPLVVREVHVPKTPSAGDLRTRFYRHLDSLLDGGERVSVYREEGNYVVSHDDGTEVLFRIQPKSPTA